MTDTTPRWLCGWLLVAMLFRLPGKGARADSTPPPTARALLQGVAGTYAHLGPVLTYGTIVTQDPRGTRRITFTVRRNDADHFVTTVGATQVYGNGRKVVVYDSRRRVYWSQPQVSLFLGDPAQAYTELLSFPAVIDPPEFSQALAAAVVTPTILQSEPGYRFTLKLPGSPAEMEVLITGTERRLLRQVTTRLAGQPGVVGTFEASYDFPPAPYPARSFAFVPPPGAVADARGGMVVIGHEGQPFLRRPAPDFQLAPLDRGPPHRLSALRGKTVMLVFWSMGGHALPLVDRADRLFGRKGLVIWTINAEPAAEVRQFLKQKGYHFTVLHDPEGVVSGKYLESGNTTAVIINLVGHVVRYKQNFFGEDDFWEMLAQAGFGRRPATPRPSSLPLRGGAAVAARLREARSRVESPARRRDADRPYAGLFRPAHRFLLPEGYVGRFRVDFDVPGKPPLPRDGDVYLIRIPPSGWLQTSSPPESGLGPIECYYAYGAGLQPVPFASPVAAASTPASQATFWGGIVSGSAGDDSGDHEGYFVGTKKQADAALMFPRIGPLQDAPWLSGKDRRKTRLRGATLRHADFSGVNLLDSDLTRADLSDAKLSGANLSAVLTGARLCRTDLRHADLFEAYLDGADLTDANLEGALLEGADLTGAKLTGARLRGAAYDMGTTWPAGFHPAAHGAMLVAPQPGHNRARYLIPKGYVGSIRVDFNVEGAPPLPTDSDGYYLVRFPSSGRLKTCSPCTFGHGNREFFYESGKQRQRLTWRRAIWQTEGGIVGYGAYESYFVGTWKQYQERAVGRRWIGP